MQMSIDLPDPHWLALLREQHSAGKSVSQIAREIDMPRSSVSMLIAGTYPAQSLDLVSRKHGARIAGVYQAGQYCPYLKRVISLAECSTQAAEPMTTGNPEKLRFWRACLHCAHNPSGGRNG